MADRPSFSRFRLFRKIALAGVGLAIPGIALAAQVKGKLLGLEKLLNPVWAEAKDVGSHRFSWREPSPTVRSEFRNLFAYAPKEVCVAAIASSSQQPPALPLLITVGGGRTTPVTVVVTPGTRLHFENRDPFPHKLYGVGQSTFPPGEMAGMAARDWTAPGPGKYEIRDALSPSIRSWVVVEPNVAAIAYPSTQGVFLIPQLAPGEYTMKAYFGGAPVGSPRSFVMSGANVDISIPVVEGAVDKNKADAGERD
ncbi:MAG TPA: hypothetical protein VJT73_04755 [Polyangiaceae bacterium]|nr:hypothetical protein [Polyangiaceae bacterium]